MQAALLQALRDATDNGHCYAVAEDLTDACRAPARDRRQRGGDAEPRHVARLDEALVAIVRAGYVVAERPGTLDRARADELRGAAIYDVAMHEAEVRLAARLASLARVEKDDLRGFAEAVEAFEKESGTVLAEEQRLAVEKAARCPLLVVTGGPGVGKTTIVKAILSVFDRAKVVTRLAAPTGRAAKRMSEATGREAATLHRLLEFEPKKNAFKRDAKNPLDAGAIIVDESSMVDVWMADALTQAIADGARLVLVGDVDQLPSVGPGSFLRDAIASGVVPCVRLVRSSARPRRASSCRTRTGSTRASPRASPRPATRAPISSSSTSATPRRRAASSSSSSRAASRGGSGSIPCATSRCSRR